ncbi:MAG: hypothetical protein HY676_00355 [Chloroflexi bacterium]|nr:hypothetical protein [Chloroflexota bacterium]
MRWSKMRVGWAEYGGLAGLAMVVGLVAWSVLGGWTIAIIPGLTYVLASGTVYLLYKQHQRERAETLVASPAMKAAVSLAQAMTFRVVGAKGVCPLGRHVGDVLRLEPDGEVTPRVCPHAAATLRLAVREDQGEEVQEWCCPIYDHLLVFRREVKAA